MDEQMIEEMTPVDEGQVECVVIYGEDGRVTACDCIPTSSDHYLSLKRKDLPVDYMDFCAALQNFKCSNGKVVYDLPEESAEKETQEAQLQVMVMSAYRATFLNELSDQEARAIPLCYDAWSSFIGKSLNQGARVEYNGKLWKVRQNIPTVLENQYPSTDTAALYEVIDVEHAGTLEDPIPYDQNMEVFQDKYYIEEGITYKCIRDSGQPLYASCASLVGNYFQTV